MKKSKIYVALALGVAVFMSACGMSEQKYNDKIINLYEHFGTVLNNDMDAIDDFQSPKAIKAITHLEKTTDSCINVMNELKPSDKAKDFHESVVNTFNKTKDFLSIAKKLTSVDPEKDNATYMKLGRELKTATSALQGAENKISSAQRKYAEAVGMKIQ